MFQGGFGIGVPIEKIEEIVQRGRETAVLISSPGDSQADREERLTIKIAFILFAIINLTITSLMYVNDTTADPASVQPYNWYIASVFDKPNSQRPSQVQAVFTGFIVRMVVGVIFVVFESALGVTLFAMGTLLELILGMAALPYYLYSFRYLLDMIMLYIALVFRSRITYSFLPTRIFDFRNQFQ